MRFWSGPGTRVEVTEVVQGERGSPLIHRERSLQSRLRSVLAAAFVGALGLSALVWYYSGALARTAQLRAAAPKTASQRLQGDAPLPSIGRIDPPPPPLPAGVSVMADRDPPTALAAAAGGALSSDPPVASTLAPYTGPRLPAPLPPAAAGYPIAPSTAPPKTPQQLALERKLEARVFGRTDRAGVEPARAGVGNATAPGEVGAANSADRAPGGESLVAAAASGPSGVVEARLLPAPHFLLPKGAFIDCTLETAIDSTLPGMATCLTATDTYGADGEIVLLERGTKLIGETRGQVLQGATRVGVIWTEARTPAGVVVPLDSAATDELGRAGLPGAVDRHFWERFGAAILITTLDGAVQAGVQSASHGGGTVIYSPGPSEAIGTEALKGTVAIAPTLRKPQGDRVQAVVAHDIDFRSVYALRLAGPR